MATLTDSANIHEEHCCRKGFQEEISNKVSLLAA